MRSDGLPSGVAVASATAVGRRISVLFASSCHSVNRAMGSRSAFWVINQHFLCVAAGAGAFKPPNFVPI
jgi:hypothetical protein